MSIKLKLNTFPNKLVPTATTQVAVVRVYVAAHLEEFVDLCQVESLLGVQFVDVAVVAVYQVQAEPHHLERTHAAALKPPPRRHRYR